MVLPNTGDKTEVGAEVNFDVGAAKANISVAGKFDIDKTSTVKAKVGFCFGL